MAVADAGGRRRLAHRRARVLLNTVRCAQGTGNGPQAQALAKKMATAWANFARTGNPSQPGLSWQAFSPDRAQTMVFDNDCRMVDDPDGEARKLLLT